MSFEHFQAFVEKTQTVSDSNELVSVLLEHVKPLGFDRMIFCLFSEHGHIGLKAGVGHLCNYPDDWMDDYMKKGFEGFDRIDPVISTLRASSKTFTWEEMEKTLPLTKDQELCLRMGEEAKLYNGVATPIWGENRFSALGFATSEKYDACDTSPIQLDLLNAISHHFYLVFERLHREKQQKAQPLNSIYLTPKEYEVLDLAVKGKSNSVIADILDMSVSTVKFHMSNIYKKLGVYDRVTACTKAIALGLAFPY